MSLDERMRLWDRQKSARETFWRDRSKTAVALMRTVRAASSAPAEVGDDGTREAAATEIGINPTHEEE